jgi:hypothetical protein
VNQVQNLFFIWEETFRKLLYTLPGGDPSTRLTIASLAIRIFIKDPRIWIFWSASTTRVLEAFSIANFVFPSLPATRPIARDR